MSSAQEHRQKIIQENIPKLIKSLTGFNEDDENFALCENYAYSKIGYHRYLSVNSHEVRRRIDGLAERFMAANLTQYGERLKELCNTLINDEVCSEHYEIDIQWKILQLLLDLSRNPVAALAENKEAIRLTDNDPEVDSIELRRQREHEMKMNELINSLVGQNIVKHDDDESELSEWSDSEIDESSMRNNQTINLSLESEEQIVPKYPSHSIDPLQKPLPYTEFDSSKALQWLKQNVQSNWWSSDAHYQLDVPSEEKEANFCHLYNKRLATISGGLYKPAPVTVASEWCLLREIIWILLYEPSSSSSSNVYPNQMTINPNGYNSIHPNYTTSASTSSPTAQDIIKLSMFFSLNVTAQKIVVNCHVSLSSVTVDGIQQILEEFAKYMTILYRFRLYFASVFNVSKHPEPNDSSASKQPSYTIECYATALKEFVTNISEFLLIKEAELVKRDLLTGATIVKLYNELGEHFRLLNYLYDIHTSSYLDYKSHSAHVCSMHLLSGLLRKTNTAPSEVCLNLAASLFLVTVKYYLVLFDSWWLEGRFDDWRQEFLVERKEDIDPISNQTSNIFTLRPLGISPNMPHSSHSALEISETISNCELIEMLNKQAVEAGYIFNILYNLDKLTEMKVEFKRRQNEQNTVGDDDLYMIFFHNVFSELGKFNKTLVNQEEYADNDGEEDEDTDVVTTNTEKSISSANEINTQIEVDVTNLADRKTNAETAFDTFCSQFADGDGDNNQLVYMIFEECFNVSDGSEEPPAQQSNNNDAENSCRIYERLNGITEFHLPFEETVLRVLRTILRSRITIANQYVLQIYRNEFNVIGHIFNLQKVFFFGAGDLMLTFYSKLFKNMNLGENWNNPYLLTVQLNEILTSKYPDVHSLFSVQLKSVNSHEKHSLDAIKDIIITYSVPDSLRDVIHEKSLRKYNAVFIFLLQIKWAIWTLETLRFPVWYKKRKPYVKLTMIDFTIKRLALVRNWVIYSIQCIHAHLMTFVIQSMGQQLIKKLEKAECLREIIELHDTYIQTIYENCFRRTKDSSIRRGIEQLLNLVVILHDEWQNIESLQMLEHQGEIEADVVDQHSNASSSNSFNLSAAVTQAANVEATYINCHCYIAEMLSAEVYTKDRTDLSALSAAFNSSCPY